MSMALYGLRDECVKSETRGEDVGTVNMAWRSFKTKPRVLPLAQITRCQACPDRQCAFQRELVVKLMVDPMRLCVRIDEEYSKAVETLIDLHELLEVEASSWRGVISRSGSEVQSILRRR